MTGYFFHLDFNLILVFQPVKIIYAYFSLTEAQKQTSMLPSLCSQLYLKLCGGRPGNYLNLTLGFVLVSVNYIQTVICHEPMQLGAAAAAVTGCVLRIPSCLLPSDSSSLAPASVLSVRLQNKWHCEETARAVHPLMNGRVGEFPLWLARLLCPPVCSQAPLVLCKQQLCSTGWSCRIVIHFSFFW